MKIEEAILKVNRIYVEGWETKQKALAKDPQAARRAVMEANGEQRLQEYLETLSTHQAGPVSVTRQLVRSLGQCPHCGAYYNAGSYIVRHQDGREVRFDLGLVHYANKGHSIAPEDVAADTLLAMVAEA